MTHFPVTFRRNFYTGEPANSFKLFGAGELELGSTITIQARQRRPFWFARNAALSFAPGQVVNVERKGQSVHFTVLTGGDIRKPGHLTLMLEDEVTALRLVQLLPATQAEITDQAQHEVDDFLQRLNAATPHAFVTPAIVIINIMVFAAMVANGIDILQPDGRMVLAWGTNFGPYTTGGQWWRLFTSMFLHFGIIHLAFNMWALYYTGRLVERLYGNLRYALLYVLAGLSGSIASLLWNPMVNSAGASGAIFGVYGALLAFMLNRRNQVPASIMKEQRLGVMVFIVYSLSYGMRQEGIDNAAHIGGLAGGLIIGWLLARPLTKEARATLGLPRLAATCTAAALAFFFLAQPIENTSENYRREEQFLADFKWVGEQEALLGKEFEKWRESGKAGSYSSEELARMLEEEVVAPWQAVYDRLAATPLEADSRLYAHQALLLESVAQRRDGFRLLAESLKTGDEEKLNEIEQHFEASNQAVKKLEQLSAGQ